MTTTDSADILAWRAYWLLVLARTAPGRLGFAILVVVLALVLTLMLTPPWLGAVLLAAFVVALDQLVLPTSYRLDSRGVEIRTLIRTRRHPWQELTTARRTSLGVHVASPYRRSLHLLVVDELERTRVFEFVQNRMRPHSST